MSGCQLDLTDPSTFTHRSVTLKNGHTYHFVDEAPQSTHSQRGVCLLLHGFPDLYGWRYQIIALKNAGFRCIVPSTLGYGGSSQPDDIRAYGFKAMSDDLFNLLSEIGISERVLLFGHDWGGVLAWRFAAYHPQNVKSIAVASTPYAPPAQDPSQWVDLETMVNTRLPNFGYQVFFASSDATQIIQSNLAAFMGFIFADPKSASRAQRSQGQNNDNLNWTLPGVLEKKLRQLQAGRNRRTAEATQQPSNNLEMNVYLEAFQKHGLRHPLMYYKSRRVSFDEELAAHLPLAFPSHIPALFLTGTDDVALPLSMSERSPTFFKDGQYEREVLEGADHWLLQRPNHREKATEILVDWAIKMAGGKDCQAKL
ncbi:alpha/beta-hydrolase [Cystobasidium minutum MCA 4210]|uniref:alpha/beta-hydrolase n=1 Tax=Cystobasidium minutum MCA 4210 TaxID=1397322 RepID=UPI0034CDA764|eukprot:jgi/Rhomi1/197621/gm1.5835_g